MNFPQELAADGNTTVQLVHPQWLGLVLTLSFLLLLASGTVSDEGCALSHLLGGWAQHYFSGGAEASQTQAQPRCRQHPAAAALQRSALRQQQPCSNSKKQRHVTCLAHAVQAAHGLRRVRRFISQYAVALTGSVGVAGTVAKGGWLYPAPRGACEVSHHSCVCWTCLQLFRWGMAGANRASSTLTASWRTPRRRSTLLRSLQGPTL